MASIVPILWSKLDSANDVTDPQQGPPGIVHGSPVFSQSGYFGNAVYSNLNNTNYLTWPLSSLPTLNMSKGAIEFWSRYTGDPGAGAYMFWSFGDATNSIYFYYYRPALGGHQFIARVVTGGIVIAQAQTPVTGNFPESILLGSCPYTHIAVVWDRLGEEIGGGITLAIYTDGILQTTWDTTKWSRVIPTGNLVLLNRWTFNLYACNIIDNIKIHDIVKTDFNDRAIESLELGDNHDFTGNKATWTGAKGMQNLIFFVKYVNPFKGIPIKMWIDIYGPISPMVSAIACAIYDEYKRYLCSTYARYDSALPLQAHQWKDFPFLSFSGLEAGRAYYFVIWGSSQAGCAVRREGNVGGVAGEDWGLMDRNFTANWPSWPNVLSHNPLYIDTLEPIWYVVINSKIGNLLVPLGPYNLLCEQTKNPVNVEDPYPEFSAIHRVSGD